MGLGCVETDTSEAAVVDNRGRPTDVFASDRPVTAQVIIGTCCRAFGRTFRRSGGAYGSNQAWFADDVHRPGDVIGKDMQRHFGGNVP